LCSPSGGFRSAGHNDTPAGDKSEVAALLERVALEIRQAAERRASGKIP